MIERNDFLQLLADHRTDEVVVYTMSPYNFWGDLSPSPLNFFVAGAMGFASSVGLGIALAQPDRKVWVLDGDGSLLMNLGTLVTTAGHAPSNLVHFVLDNGIYELVGDVPTLRPAGFSFAGMASAAGIPRVHELTTAAEAQQAIPGVLDGDGPAFITVKVTRAPKKTVPGMKTFSDGADNVRRVRAGLTTGAVGALR